MCLERELAMTERVPCVVIVGGGFGGLAAARALNKSAARIILIDRTNHHLFQPLLYQVATSVLTPGQIGFPIRQILGRQSNTTVTRLAGKNGRRPFRYFDKGNMAVVGKGFAVLQSGKLSMSGVLAWFAWAAVHLGFLAQPGLQMSVFVQWVWTLVTGQRGSGLIVDHTRPERVKAIPTSTASAAPESQPPLTAVVSSK
jgi:NADH dehydrogenase FAD-containing subunit